MMSPKWFLISPPFKKPPSNIFLYVLCANILKAPEPFLWQHVLLRQLNVLCQMQESKIKFKHVILRTINLLENINGTREAIFGRSNMQKVHNSLLDKHCAQTLQLHRDKSAKSLASISISYYMAPASVCETISTFFVWNVCVCVVPKDQAPEVLLLFRGSCLDPSLSQRSPLLQ